MKVIFGLGNPGPEYKQTRHNIGYMVLDALAKEQKAEFRNSFRWKCAQVKVTFGANEVLLVKPRTYMNCSGGCVKKFVDHYKLSADDFLVVYDEIDLPFGAMRFRQKGSAAGHRGMYSILSALDENEVNRLRIGIDKPQDRAVADYVLAKFSSEEQDEIDGIVSAAKDACSDWACRGNEYVMQKYNTRVQTE